uniref:ORF48 n=1 Tax=Malaco herpesvirus 2 TaxID=3031798 RepID=A0AA48P7L5_9VIRU|nr:TPA_asm: ORF48 [Malaco herpesvirus 2]
MLHSILYKNNQYVELITNSYYDSNLSNMDRWTGLHHAVQGNEVSIVKTLLHKNANVSRNTTLHFATRSGKYIRIVELLLKYNSPCLRAKIIMELLHYISQLLTLHHKS